MMIVLLIFFEGQIRSVSESENVPIKNMYSLCEIHVDGAHVSS